MNGVFRCPMAILLGVLAFLAQSSSLGQEKEINRVKSILSDRERWNSASDKLQDKAILQIGKQLGQEYKFIETKKYSCNKKKARIATFKHLKTGILLNLIPGGTYIMGAQNGNLDEKPAHKVTINAMLVGKYEVTQSQWVKTKTKNHSHFKAKDNPVENVKWNELKDWFGKAGGELRLPSESEWEYACRGATTTKYFWGDKMNGDYCWYLGNSKKSTHSVYLHKDHSNAFGLVDMIGHVAEWCLDRMNYNYKDGPNDSRPRLTGTSSYRVNRGGNWKSNRGDCRSAWRASYSPLLRRSSIGFRVFRSLKLTKD